MCNLNKKNVNEVQWTEKLEKEREIEGWGTFITEFLNTSTFFYPTTIKLYMDIAPACSCRFHLIP